MRRKLTIGIGSIVGLIALFVIVIGALIDDAEIFAVLTESVEKETGSRLVIGEDSTVSLFPTLGINLKNVTLTPEDESSSSVSASEVEVGVTLSSLLAGTLEIKSVRAIGVETSIIQTDEESENVSKSRTDEELQAHYANRKAELETGIAGEGLPPIPLNLEVGLLEIRSAQVELINPQANTSQIINLEELSVRNLNTRGDPASVSVLMSVSGETNIELDIQTETTIDLSQGIVSLTNLYLEIVGVTPKPLSISAAGEVDLTREIAKLDIEVGTDVIEVNGSVARNAYESPEIDMVLSINLIDPAMLVSSEDRSSSQKSTSSSDTSAEASNTLDDPLPLDPLRDLDIRAQLEIAKVSIGPNILNNVGASLRIVEGMLTLSEVAGEFNGGFLSLETQLNGKYNKASFSAEGGLEGLDFDQLAASYGAPDLLSGTGGVSLALNSEGTTPRELIRNLKGPVNVKTSEVTLQRINLEKTMCQGIALVNKKLLSSSFPNKTEFASLNADLRFADGTAKIGPFSADLASLKLDGAGLLNLESSDFTLGLESTILQSIGELDPACVLDSKYTNLTWPVNCEGNLMGDSSEWCKVDTAEVLAQFAKETVKEEAKKKAKTYIKKLFGG